MARMIERIDGRAMTTTTITNTKGGIVWKASVVRMRTSSISSAVVAGQRPDQHARAEGGGGGRAADGEGHPRAVEDAGENVAPQHVRSQDVLAALAGPLQRPRHHRERIFPEDVRRAHRHGHDEQKDRESEGRRPATEEASGEAAQAGSGHQRSSMRGSSTA